MRRETMTMRRRVIFTLVVILSGVVLYWLDPAQYVFMPKCIFRMLTGWDCPGCGLQRAVHALLHGRFWEAVQYNYFLLLGIPYVLAVMYMEWFTSGEKHLRLRRVLYHRYVLYAYVALYLAWWVLRNVLGV